MITFFTLFLLSFSAFSQSIVCGQSNCVPVTTFPSTVDIQEKAGFSSIDLNFLGVDLNISTIPNQKSKDVRMFLLNGIKDDAKDVTIDLSSSSLGNNGSNLIMIGDNFNNLNLKMNGYNGANGKDASEICADNIQSLKYGAASNLKYLQNRANPANGLSANRCGSLDVSDLATDKFACNDPNFIDVSSTQSISVERVQKVSKCMAIIPQPICVQPAYEVTCNYDLWIKNMPNDQGGGEGLLRIRPDSVFNVSDQSTFDVLPYYTPDGGGRAQFNNTHKNNILFFKDEINDGTNGMFFWDFANYILSTTYYELHDGCSGGGFGAQNAISAPYIPAYSNVPYVPFTRANPVIPNNIYFSNASTSFNPVNIQTRKFILNSEELQTINNTDKGLFHFCNARYDKFPSTIHSRLGEVNSHISQLETNLNPSSVAYFRRNNLNAYGGDGCNGRVFATARYRNDFTFRARENSQPTITSPGLDASGLRLAGGTLITPNTNAEKSYSNPQGWKMDIMKGFAGSDPQSSNTLLQKTCNTNYNLVSVESVNAIKYEDILPDTSLACNAIESCDSPSDSSPSCLIDPNSVATFTYIGLDPDPQGRIETVSCTLGGSCPVENRLLEDSRFLDTLTPTNGESGTEQGSGFVFVYDVNNRLFQTQVGQAGAGGKNDLASPTQIKYCAKKRDATTDPNSGYRNDPSVEFKRINWKTFEVNGGGVPGTVPQFSPKKIFLYKKIDPGVLYLLKKELL